MDIKLNIIKKHGSYIVRRIDGGYNQHAHINKYSTCKLLIKLIHTNKLPTSEYLQGSCRRLLTDEEYSRLRPKKKQQYVNKGGCL